MANKVRFGLRNTKYAIWDPTLNSGAGGYGTPKALPGAVSLSLSREGGDSSDFYADDGIYFTFAGTNGGYSGDLELARITDEVRKDLLGEVVDNGTGVQFETTTAEAAQFALITEMQGDSGPIGFVFYNCKDLQHHSSKASVLRRSAFFIVQLSHPDRKSTRLNSSHSGQSRMPSSA